MQGRIYTIGHSNHSMETMLELLNKYHINTVIDVRSRPQSRYVSHFNKKGFCTTLERLGKNYLWGGKFLGGLSIVSVTDPIFIEKMDKIISMVEEHDKSVALMCSEKNPLVCHRSAKLGVWLLKERYREVLNIYPDKKCPEGILPQSEAMEKMGQKYLWHEYGGGWDGEKYLEGF